MGSDNASINKDLEHLYHATGPFGTALFPQPNYGTCPVS